MPVRWFPSSLTDFCKKLSYVLDQEIRLFKRGKVPTPRHFRPLDYIVFLSNPAKRRDSHFPRKICIPDRSLQACRLRSLYLSDPVLTIDSHGGAHRAGRPIERNIGQKCVAVHRGKKVAVVVRKHL